MSPNGIEAERGDIESLSDVEHVDQVRKYKSYPFFAQKGVILIRKTIKVPEEVREYTRDSIKIIRKQARRRNRSFWERLFG